ncbi:unnamed protein product, partial [Mesorhabditis belari]|uniref:Carboxylic ester hydrolase n=1 Tax=Mesorhabditis belari TaxID=2138241 RepID=A0AAF3E7S2_9BILA
MNSDFSTGFIQGIDVKTNGNTSGIAFMGIPLAEPPIGALRLEKPMAASSWEGVLSAVQYRNACLSDPVRTYKRNDGGPVSEDCLYVNVFTNRRCLVKGGCAVLALIHGGRYTMESPVSFSPQIIVNNFPGQDRDVIVVGLPYRLGFLGFFNLPHSSVPQNLAIYDLKLGLEWIQREIQNFGGDPRRVTIYGHSAGAQIVDPLSMSPQFEGLFSAVISQSGNAAHRDTNFKIGQVASKRIIYILGCADESTNDLTKRHLVRKALKCVREKSSSEILEAQIRLNDYIEDYTGISIDDFFFPEPLAELAVKRRKIPTLVGTVTGEMDSTKFVEKANGLPNREDLSWICRVFTYGWSLERPELAAQKCVQEYSQVNRSRHLYDDSSFFSSTIDFALSQIGSRNKEVYVYSYAYSGAGRAYNAYQKDRSDSPLHSEDYIYVFGLHRGEFVEKDYEVERVYTGIIANFVKHHNPSFEGIAFPQFTQENFEHLRIDFDENGKFNGAPALNYYKREYEFWDYKMKSIGGKRKSLQNPPPGFDNFDFSAACKALEVMRPGYSKDDKSIASVQKSFIIWNAFLEKSQERYVFEAESRSLITKEQEISEENAKPLMLSTYLLIGGILMLLAILLVSIMKFIQYRKRNSYQEI